MSRTDLADLPQFLNLRLGLGPCEVVKCMKTTAGRRSQIIDVVGGIDDIELVQYGDKNVLR